MMKRKLEQNNKDNADSLKKLKTQETETGHFDDENQSSERSPDQEIDLDEGIDNVDGGKENMGITRKKKGKTSYVWNHFSIRFADDQKMEFAHCNYCARY